VSFSKGSRARAFLHVHDTLRRRRDQKHGMLVHGRVINGDADAISSVVYYAKTEKGSLCLSLSLSLCSLLSAGAWPKGKARPGPAGPLPLAPLYKRKSGSAYWNPCGSSSNWMSCHPYGNWLLPRW